MSSFLHRRRRRVGPMSRWTAFALGVTLAALAGCSVADRPPGATTATGTVPVERCFSGLPDGARTTEHMLPVADGEAAVIGFPADGAGTVMVLLHQTGNLGACGWGRFATAAQAAGVASAAVDLCGFGRSTCSADADQTEVVDAAVRFARGELGAQRVVLVGASMGAHLTVAAVADGVEVDAWADVSGPDAWGDVRLSSLDWPRGAGGEAMVMFGADEPPEEIAAARRVARATGATWVLRPQGHGYELLTSWRGRLSDGGRQLLRFVEPSA